MTTTPFTLAAVIGAMGMAAAVEAAPFHPEARGYFSDFAERSEDSFGREAVFESVTIDTGVIGHGGDSPTDTISVLVEAGSQGAAPFAPMLTMGVCADTDFSSRRSGQNGRSPGFGVYPLGGAPFTLDECDATGGDGITGDEFLTVTFSETVDALFDISETVNGWKIAEGGDGVDHTPFNGTLLTSTGPRDVGEGTEAGLLEVLSVDSFTWFGTPGVDFYVDLRAVTPVAPVPVPAALPLALAGLGALGWVRSRRRAD